MAAIAFLFVTRLLPESSVPDRDALRLSKVLHGYGRLLQNSDFLIHTAMLGVALGLIFVFVTGAPFVLMNMLGVATEQFGFYQASIVASFFLGSVLASRLADRWSAMSMLRLGVSMILANSAPASRISDE